jgi:hypothetical protein
VFRPLSDYVPRPPLWERWKAAMRSFLNCITNGTEYYLTHQPETFTQTIDDPGSTSVVIREESRVSNNTPVSEARR